MGKTKPAVFICEVHNEDPEFFGHVIPKDTKTKAADVWRGFEMWTEVYASSDHVKRCVTSRMRDMSPSCEIQFKSVIG